jgi:hypothetical protein
MTNERNEWNDYDYVIQRVAQHGYALQYTSDDLRNNKEIVLIAVAQDGEALQFASDDLRKSKEIVLIAVAQNGLALEFASKELRNDPEIVKIAVKNHGFALRYASKQLKNNKEIVLIAVANFGFALLYASEELTNDPEIFWEAIEQNPNSIKFAGKEICDIYKSKYRIKALIMLTKDNKLNEVIELIDLMNYDDINTQNDFGISPLMWFCGNGNIDIVKILLNKGAKIDLKDDWGYDALYYAKTRNHQEIVNILEDCGRN